MQLQILPRRAIQTESIVFFQTFVKLSHKLKFCKLLFAKLRIYFKVEKQPMQTLYN